MHYVAVIVLGVLGAIEYGLGGLVFGGLLGLALALLAVQRRELAVLGARLDALTGAEDGAAPEPPEVAERPQFYPAQASAADAPGAPAASPPPVGPRSGRPPLDPRVAAAIAAVRGFFTTGNLVVRVGVVVLFFGVAFLLRYAYENALVPIELRLIGTTLFGIALAIAGWRWRHRSDTYGLVLQGAGVGLMYLTIFAAARLYGMLPMGGALLALVALVAATSVLAVVQRAQALAIFSMSGGFLAPVLVSTGEGSHVALFSYYALLNSGIVVMAWFQRWRWLNWVGFMFTFAIGALWGYRLYEPRYFATTEPFLVLSFLFYLGVSVLFSRRDPVDLRGVVDGTLVFGTPVIAFALQAALVREMPFGLAYSAFGAAATYVGLALWLKRQGMFATLLGSSFVALGVGFATLAIPFAFDDQRFTAATWALEGAGLVWVGLRQHQKLPRIAGLALQGLAALAFLSDWQRGGDAVLFLNGAWFGAVMIAVGAGFSGYLLSRHDEELGGLERALAVPFLFWAALWWLAAGGREIMEFTPSGYGRFEANLVPEHLFVLFAAASFAALTYAVRALRWPAASKPGYLLLPLVVAWGAVVAIDSGARDPLSDLGWLAWPAAAAAVLWHLRGIEGGRLAALWHAGTWWSVAFLAAWAGYALVDATLPDSAWSRVWWGFAPTLVVAALLAVQGRSAWPLSERPNSYFGWGMLVMMAYLLCWTLATGLFAASPDPLPYVVVLNPIELVQLAVLILGLLWTRRLADVDLVRRSRELQAVIGIVAFAWLNLTAARAVHEYGGVPYPFGRIADSDLFQATTSILWTLVALVLMGFGSRRSSRPSWIVGAVLLGLAIVKLFLVDLSNLDTVARIVSFVSVGVLMLVIGYLAPLPPNRARGAVT